MSRKRAVNKLIEYIKIKSVHPEPDYDGVIKFLKDYANEIGFDSYKQIEVCPGRFVVLMSYYGKSKEKSSILLNSHMDVVPVDEKYWKYEPFSGFIDENGNIYGRGTQDMKSVGIQHLEIIRRMKENSIRPERTIHLSFVPDEEIGGLTGMNAFLETDEFREINVGLALDEGRASSNDEFCVYYGERVTWWVEITCVGNTGHGSRFIEKTAAEKLQRIINKLLDYRDQQKQKLNDECLKLGDVTTINLTQLSGGLARNIVPAEFKASFDIRITPKTTIKEFEKMFQNWLREAECDDTDSGRITYVFKNKPRDFAITSIDENENKWWKCFHDTCKEINIKTNSEIFPAATDSRYLRLKNIPAFGFTPLNNTPNLMHDHNEFVNEKKFLDGIEILYEIVLNMANLN